jgi:flavodoxin I
VLTIRNIFFKKTLNLNLMASVGIFYGSDTGNTELVAKSIKRYLKDLVHIQDIAKSSKAQLDNFDLLLLGIPTWYYGEAQSDWEDFLPELEQVDFSSKLVAIFGCGDQQDYAEYFCDAMGIVHDIVEAKGGTIIGYTPTKSYNFEASKALIQGDMNKFVGLCIDEDRQPELTDERISSWTKQVYEEMNLNDL